MVRIAKGRKQSTQEANAFFRIYETCCLRPYQTCLAFFGRGGVLAILGMIVVGIAFYFTWQAREWQAFLTAIASGLGAMLGASAGLLSPRDRGRWILALGGGVFVAWVGWYTTSELTTQLGIQAELSETRRRQIEMLKGDLIDYAKLMPVEQQRTILKEAGIRLRARYNDAIAVKRRPFAETDFALSRDITNFIHSLDKDNGHSLLFSGLLQRALGDHASGRRRLDEYLIQASRFSAAEDSAVTHLPCRTPEGFCRERTAYVFHLFANDFYADGIAGKHTGKTLQAVHMDFVTALKHACSAIKLFPPIGFHDPKQHIPTLELERLLKIELGNGCPPS